VPSVFEQAKLTPEQGWWLDFRANLNDLGRILVTTPGVPADRLSHLRAAVKNALTNPALIEEGARTQRFVKYQPPEEALEITQKVLTLASPEQKERLRQVIFRSR
jgi:hypothetical protein